MKSKNIWSDVAEPLEIHEDDRGSIVDIFYKSEIEHAAVIKSKKDSIRGNHYHLFTTQHMLITKGSLEYWYKPLDSKEKSKVLLMKEGDFVTTPPSEVHALKILEDNEFIVFTEGVRGGKDYEEDTIRIDGTIIGGSKDDS
jgi:dTDP-4-dehydrorhamnose 3,5-epimerase-like enzyme